MDRRWLVTLAALTMGAAGTAACGSIDPAVMPLPPGYRPGVCSVSILFGSYGFGIDQDRLSTVRGVASARVDLVSATEDFAWGDDGERWMCIQTHDRSQNREAFSVFAHRIAGAGMVAPIKVIGQDGDIFEVNRRERKPPRPPPPSRMEPEPFLRPIR